MGPRGRLLLACLLFLLSACLPPLCSGQCQTAGRFGEDCQHQCHCQQTCDLTTGICPTRCTGSYEGPTCQKRNAARGKPATASSTFGNGWTADKAVDGDTRQDVHTGTCFHSNVNRTSATWAVDLGDVYPMDNIVIYYREGYVRRFRTVQIIVANSTAGGTLCANGSTPTEESNDVLRYNCSSFGSHLILKQDGNCGDCVLEPCEVQIFVCTAGFRGRHCTQGCSGGRYGEGCLSQCGHCDGDTLCRSTDGVCPQGCQPGWRGDHCQQVCINGTYGENCTTECGHCSDGANCHHVTGSCLSGSCQLGYRGDRCDQSAIQAAFDSGFSAGHTSGLGKGVGIGAGAVLGVVLLVAVVSLAVVCSRRRRRQQNGSSQPGVPPGSVSRPDPDQSTHYSTSAPVSGAENHYETLGMESLQADAGIDVSKRK